MTTPSGAVQKTVRSSWRIAALGTAVAGALIAGGLLPSPAAAAAPTTIAEVQGTGATSPLAGQTVTVEGVVTGDYRTGGYKGITIQTAGSGGAERQAGTASDGLFVYLGALAPTLQIGDLVSVTGEVSEYYDQTQISPAAIGDVAVVTAGVGVPEATPLPDTVLGADREAWESMLVAPTGSYLLSSSHQLYNYGSLWLSAGDELPVKSTEQSRPGAEADAIAAANSAQRILLDDGWSSQVTSSAHTGEQPYFTEDVVVRNGDRVVFPAQPYILGYGFDDWRLQPTIPIDDASPAEYKPGFETLNPRPASAPEVAGDAHIAAFNVYNYFTTLQSEDEEARGAKTAELFQTQRSKIITAIDALGADVVGLMEIENSIHFGKPIDTAVADLVAGLNEKAGAQEWAFVPTPAALNDVDTTDVITSAIIYRTSAATPVGDSQTIVDENVWSNAREPIGQAFDIDGKIVNVVTNHLKSKSPPADAGAEPADGQGFFNADRVAQAKSVLAFADQIAASSGSTDTILLGDFNSYAEEDPIDVFAQAGWTDLLPAKAAGQYTYTYDGELGSLDHAIASPSLAASVAGAGVWTINSPEWSDRGYEYSAADASSPFRSSDHDPVLVGISTTVPPVDIDVFTINDFHGRIEADGSSAGAAVLAGAVADQRAENANTIFAGNGDLVGGSTFTSFIQDDNPTIDALNAAGLQVSSTGNHEYDQGWDDLKDRISARADWPYLAANVFLKGTDEHALDPYTVIETDGIRVGFIGAVTTDLPSLVSADGLAALDIRDVAESVNAVADDLSDGDPANGEADVIILLAHDGAPNAEESSITPDSTFGKIVQNVNGNVDAISSAHTHQVYNHVIDGRPVFQAGEYGENFALTHIQVDPRTKQLLSISNEIKPLTAEDESPLYPAVPEVQAIVDDAVAQADVLGTVSVGEITADFNRARQSDGSENRGGESTIGNFLADVHRWATGADIALMNPGGIRADLTFASSGEGDADGNVTYREAATVQPFANTLVTVELTGAQIKSVLEEQWQPEGSSRPFLKLGVSEGLSYTYDPTAAAGSHITAITLNGEPLDEAGSYVVAANSFLAAGGDNFTTLAEGTNRADTGKIDLESTVDWFEQNGTATPDDAQRAVGVVLGAPAADGAYHAGDELTIDLSSLVFTGGEKVPQEVTVSLGGAVQGTAAIDPAPVDTTDEAGRATLAFTVPEGTVGTQDLTITVPGTGTVATIPVAFADDGTSGTATLTIDKSTVAAGGTVTITGTGFAANAEIALELHSVPVSLGSAVADAAGGFQTTVTIPAATAAGEHELVALPAGAAQVSVPITVTAASASTGGASQGGNLATTGGGDLSAFVAAGALLLLLGGLLIAVRRGRRAQS